VIRQGEVYWLHFGAAEGSAPAGRRPALVVQHDRFNRSTISTTVVAAITSHLRLGAMPGNVRLRRGEAGLPHASVVNVSQIRTIDRIAMPFAAVGNDSAVRRDTSFNVRTGRSRST